MSYDDFCRLTPDEFEQVCKAFAERHENNEQAEWERMRMLATITIQPHVKNKITPDKLLPFPWERKNSKPLPTAEESKKRFEALVARRRTMK